VLWTLYPTKSPGGPEGPDQQRRQGYTANRSAHADSNFCACVRPAASSLAGDEAEGMEAVVEGVVADAILVLGEVLIKVGDADRDADDGDEFTEIVLDRA
jgi:hypothetical protein